MHRICFREKDLSRSVSLLIFQADLSKTSDDGIPQDLYPAADRPLNPELCGQNERRNTMQKLQMLSKITNRIIIAVTFILVIGWFQHAETRSAEYPYVPLITKISPFPKSGQPAWIEFHNPLTEPVKASNLMIVINDEYKYTFPKQLPPILPKGYVLLKLDGKDAPEVFSYRRGATELHTPWDLTEVMKGKPGQIAVYRNVATAAPKFHLAGFVSWGAPGSRKSQTLERDRLWKPEWFVEMGQGTGEYNPEAIKKADYVIGLYPGSKTAGLTDWVVYARDEARPGKPNVVPRPVLFIPHDGAVVRSKDISIRWIVGKHARAYRFQMAKDPDFGKIIEDSTLKFPVFRPAGTLEEGAYYYRVKIIDIAGRESAFSVVRMLIAKWMDKIRPLPWEKILTANHVPQIKDSRLLCLDGCSSDLNSTATMHWDEPHPPVNIFSIISSNPDHGLGNCVRASIAMMVSVYGKTLSQDRIAYYTEEESAAAGDGRPEGDLAHFVGMTYMAIDGGDA